MKTIFFPSTKLNNIHDFNNLELTNILLPMLFQTEIYYGLVYEFCSSLLLFY